MCFARCRVQGVIQVQWQDLELKMQCSTRHGVKEAIINKMLCECFVLQDMELEMQCSRHGTKDALLKTWSKGCSYLQDVE